MSDYAVTRKFDEILGGVSSIPFWEYRSYPICRFQGPEWPILYPGAGREKDPSRSRSSRH